MEDLRKEIKRKFNSLTVIQLGLITYWYKLHNEMVQEIRHSKRHNCGDNFNSKYSIRIYDILKEVL
jgi:hypothetical protein|tara:strand:- start:346 stop:543 length:198 start_codon:yes stop_codon:yes gene_type:complete